LSISFHNPAGKKVLVAVSTVCSPVGVSLREGNKTLNNELVFLSDKSETFILERFRKYADDVGLNRTVPFKQILQIVKKIIPHFGDLKEAIS
jgi:hypothetical protein